MKYKKRNILIVLAVIALALALCAVLFSACKSKEKEDDGVTAYGEIVVLDDGAVSHTYSLEIGSDVYSYMQGKVSDFDKEHAEFDHFEYDGNELTSGLSMTSSVTLTAVYKIEITLEINAKNITGYEEWQDDGDYTHMDSLDVRYYAFAGTSFTADVEEIEGLTGESGKNSSSARTITVSSDYTKNIIPLYYGRDDITVRLYTNYPADSGMTDGAYETRYTYFGYPVTLPSGYTCEGYIMLGWSSTQRATSPDYPVDSVSSSLMVWNGTTHSYEPAEVSDEEVVFYPRSTTPMYIVWGKGYKDLFGSGDVVYILEDGADVAYLSRAGFLYESTRKVGELYYFENSDTGTSFRLRLSDDYVFAYYDESRVATYYEFEFAFDGTSLSGNEHSSDYIVFSETDEFVYHTGSSENRGIYRMDDYGLYHLTYKSGSLAGQTATIVLGTYGDDDVFMFENEEEADMGLLPIGFVGYDDDDGLYTTYYLTGYYYLYLDGFNNCLYYSLGTSYTYTYYLDGDTLYLFYYSSSYGYQLSGTFKRFSVSGSYAWFLYDGNTDGTFNLYDGDDIVGTIECDGYFTAVYTPAGGTPETTIYYTDYFAMGVAMYLGIAGDEGTQYADYIVTLDECGYYAVDDDGNYMVSVLPDTYAELYRYDESGIWYDMMILDYAGEGTCAYVIVGYDYYGYGYYFTALTGTYNTYTSENYPDLVYYVFTVDEGNTESLEEYFYYYIYYYYSALDLSELANVKSLAFVVSSVSSTYYTYPINVWMWYDPEANSATETETSHNPWAGDTSVTYFEEYEKQGFEITFVYGEYELDDNGDFADASSVEAKVGTLEGTLKIILLDGGLLYGTFTYCDGNEPQTPVTIDIYGYYNGTATVDDKQSEAYTATCLFLDFGVTKENYKENTNYYIYGYTYIYVTFDTSGAMAEVTEIPVYIYGATIEDGPSDDVYLSYNGISWEDELTYTYFDGQDTYTGTIAEKESSDDDPFGNTIYTFTSKCDSYSFDFVYMYYGSTTVFMVYDDSKIATYTGKDGSKIVTDPIGYQLIYTDAKGDAHTLTYSYFNIVLPEGDGDDSFAGHHESGYIQLLIDGELYTFDILDGDSKQEGETYDYELRGSEFGEYYIVDNLLSQYIVYLDGYGNAYLYSVEADEDGNMVRVGTGTYEIEDTYIDINCTIGEEGDEGKTSYTLQAAEMDLLGMVYVVGDDETMTYMYYGGIYINHVEYTGTYISYTDMSTLELSSNGGAVRYCSDGTIETGVYTWLDASYFYYVNDAGTFGNIFYVVDGYNVRKEDYSSSVSKYFSADMRGYIEFTSNGRVTFDYGNSYYYYTVADDLTITVYYVPSVADRTYANTYGYCTYDFGKMGETYTATSGTVYYNILWNRTTFTLSRKEGEERKYNFGYLGYTYSVGDLQLLSAYTDETGSLGYIYMTYEGASAGYGYAYVYIVENTEKETEDDSDILIYVYVDSSSEYSYSWGYYDYIYYCYTIEVDLSTWTYSITDEKLYLDSYMYEYLWYYYYYGSSYATYYYSYITFEWDVSENGTVTESAAYGYVLPYIYYDVVDGGYVYTFCIDGAPFTLDEYGIFTIDFEGGDGETYEIQLYLDYSQTCALYYGYYCFVTVDLWQPESFEYAATDGGNKYTLDIGYVIYSTVYSSGSLLLDFHAYSYDSDLDDYGEISFDTVAILTVDGKIFYLVERTTSSGSRQYYYEISFETDEEDKTTSMTVAVSETITRYYLDDGTSYVDVYVSEESKMNEIVLVYIADEGYYSVQSCEYDEDGERYKIVLSSGTYYVTVKDATEDEGSTNSATMSSEKPETNEG